MRLACLPEPSPGTLPARDDAFLPFTWPLLFPPDLYMTFPGKSFVGTKIADLSFPSLQAAKQQCSALGEGCDVVVSTMTGHHLMVGKRFVTLEDPGAAAAAAVHVKTRCSPGYSGQDCQSMCPRCEPSLSCNPLTGLCDGFLYYREAPGRRTGLARPTPSGSSISTPTAQGWQRCAVLGLSRASP